MKNPIRLSILVVALAATAVLYFWLESKKPPPQIAAPPATPEEPAIRHPIEGAHSGAEPPAERAEPLPALADSDGPMRDALAGLFGRSLEKYFILTNIIHRIVATVDNLPRHEVPLRLMPVKPVRGRPVTAGKGEKLSLSPRNAARYKRYVQLAKSVPTGPLVAVYVEFYSLFQEQYEKLGYPGRYFNDRLVEVIDHLLASPEVQEPVLLRQPKVLFEFADPKLEGLSGGQKILVRMGSENAAKVKAKLREIRAALVAQGPKGSR